VAKILVVDDQEYIRLLVSEILMDDGHLVVTAKDAMTSRLHLEQFRPDLVILDLFLDGPEGFPLFQSIKGKVPDVPVIIFTAYDSYRWDERLSKADDYVLKSLDFTELTRHVQKVLATKQPEPSTVPRSELWPGGERVVRE
jgi:DNA-binding response OmpR family regulator